MIQKISPICGRYMVFFLTACCFLSLTTIIVKRSDLVPEAQGWRAVLNGQVVSQFEKKFEEHLLFRDQIVGVWGAIQYGLLKSGGKKVVVGTDDWLYTSEEFEHLSGAQDAEERLMRLITKINSHLKSHNITLAVTLVPAKARIYPEHLGRHHLPQEREGVYDRVRSSLISMNIPAPDMVDIFLKEKTEQPLYLRLDTHWTPAGAALAAQVLRQSLDQTFLESLKQEAGFKTENLPPEIIEGDLEKYIKTGFFHAFLAPPQERVSLTKTLKMTADDSGDGLFGAETLPVVLVGTSYSAIDKWNFEGALKTALQADVLNLADEGQGPLEPMADFLEKTNLENTDIKLVIWEIPERFVSVSYPDVKFPTAIEDHQ
ncbi:MAG: hypothetical protein IT559_01805 [Alphaproteobacteria bacterium]|nr:hypothetical protein [Alphaproteobacteria bacterium]